MHNCKGKQGLKLANDDVQNDNDSSENNWDNNESSSEIEMTPEEEDRCFERALQEATRFPRNDYVCACCGKEIKRPNRYKQVFDTVLTICSGQCSFDLMLMHHRPWKEFVQYSDRCKRDTPAVRFDYREIEVVALEKKIEEQYRPFVEKCFYLMDTSSWLYFDVNTKHGLESRIIGAFVGDDLLGVAALGYRYNHDEQEEQLSICVLVVEREYRRAGVCTGLLGQAERLFLEKLIGHNASSGSMLVNVEHYNRGAIAAYENFGFKLGHNGNRYVLMAKKVMP